MEVGTTIQKEPPKTKKQTNSTELKYFRRNKEKIVLEDMIYNAVSLKEKLKKCGKNNYKLFVSHFYTLE